METPVASPFKSVLKISDQEHEKALKTAFYNAAAILFVFVSGVIVVGVYHVLEMFLRPLIWATLCGAFIFPFKNATTKIVQDWLHSLQHDNVLVVTGLCLIPINGVNRSVDYIGQTMKANLVLLVYAFLGFLVAYLLIIYQPYYYILLVLSYFNKCMVAMLWIFSYPLVVWSIIIGFTILLFYCKRENGESSETSWWLSFVSMFVWYLFLFHLVSLCGPIKVPLGIAVAVLIILGAMSHYKKVADKADEGFEAVNEVEETKNKEDEEEEEESINEINDSHDERRKPWWEVIVADVRDKVVHFYRRRKSHPKEDAKKDTTLDSSIKEDVHLKEKDETKPAENLLKRPVVTFEDDIPSSAKRAARRFSESRKKHLRYRRKGRNSDPYFIALFWLFAISRVWLHPWILVVIPAPLLILLLKTLYIRLGLSQTIKDKTKRFSDPVCKFYEDRAEIILPGPVREILSVWRSFDRKFVSLMCNSTDLVITCLIIICLGFFAIFLTAFCCVQVHHESSYLVTVATNVVNKTIVSNQEYLSWMNLDEKEVRKTLDNAIHKGYMMARQRAATMISSIVKTNSSSSDSSTSVEDDVTNILDQLYETWITKNDSVKEKPPLPRQFEDESNNSMMAGFWKVSWNKYSSYLSVSEIANLVKENVHTFQSVLDSLWTILKGNMSLVISLITHIISIVLSSGTYLLNSIVSLIVFTTTLFYLLQTSSDEYKVITLFSSVSMGTSLGDSINQAVQDVFGASLKMGIFYGIYTWFTHSMFGGNLVFIPTAFAAILGMVPFLGTYWAAFPACLELWLIHNEGIRALLLLVLHFIPTSFVDTAIYREIGIHPYLTALSIAGGVVHAGLEGAFIGPFVLVCLVASIDIYGRLISSPPPNISAKKAWRRAISEDISHH